MTTAAESLGVPRDCQPGSIESTHTVWVSIGRNIGAEPMSEQDWCDFFANVHTSCVRAGEVITNVTGRSFWNGQDEDTRLILVSVPDANLATLRQSLARWAKHYRQDAIGFVADPFGDTLITP